MSTIDNFLYGTKHFIDSATDKTNEFIETTKIKYDRSQLNVALRDEYTKLGKICYSMTVAGLKEPEKMSSVIARINQLKEKIEIANDQLSSCREKFCEECGTTNPSKFHYCSKCGTKLN